MEESTSILSIHGSTGGELNIRQPFYNNAPSKLLETENTLNRVFEEYTGRIESFMLMMDLLKEGILIINNAGETCYANEPGNTFLRDWNKDIAGHLTYRLLAAEQLIEVSNKLNHSLQIRSNNFFWNGEQCNIFIIEEAVLVNPSITLPTPTQHNELLQPLMNYMQQIAEYETAGKTDEVADYAQLANNTIAYNEKLINDAKIFMGLVNYKPVLQQISMQKIVGDVLKSMGAEIEEAAIEVSVSELPEATADKELVTKFLKHLISNALKFRNKSKKAIIDIGHDKSDGQFIFCVRDNGIGISKKHHDEIFNLFATLNDQHQYPGNGMGLALCKKIVELHNGTIWVESLPGHGSNFYFKFNAQP